MGTANHRLGQKSESSRRGSWWALYSLSKFKFVPAYHFISFSMVTRTTTPYEAQYQRFVLSNKDYGQQFCHMYSQRISQMKEMLSECIKESESDVKLRIALTLFFFPRPTPPPSA